MLGLVYKFVNKINGKIYIGKTTDPIETRIFNHCNDARKKQGFYFHKALNKYGIENFTIYIIFKVNNLDLLNKAEIFFIRKYKSNNPKYGYNLTTGGEGGKPNAMCLISLKRGVKRSFNDPSRILKQQGANNGRSKLSEKQVILIRKLYWDEKKTRDQLYLIFSNTVQIETILKRESWKHIVKLDCEPVKLLLWDRKTKPFIYLSLIQLKEIFELREQGYTQQIIADHFNCAQTYIGKKLKENYVK